MSRNIGRHSSNSRRLLIIAGTVVIVIGSGHLLLLSALRPAVTTSWVSDGIWAVVPFIDPAPSIESLTSSVTFWSGIGGFPIPLILLGVLIIHYGRRGVTVPSWLGWTIGLWGLIAGILLGPTPYLILPVAGALIVGAGRITSASPVGQS